MEQTLLKKEINTNITGMQGNQRNMTCLVMRVRQTASHNWAKWIVGKKRILISVQP